MAGPEIGRHLGFGCQSRLIFRISVLKILRSNYSLQCLTVRAIYYQGRTMFQRVKSADTAFDYLGSCSNLVAFLIHIQ